MGKGKRIREERSAVRESQKETKIKKAKSDKIKRISIIAVAVVLIVSLFGGVMYHVISSAAYNSGRVQRNTVVLETKNHKVNAAMLTYYFNYELNTMVNTYSNDLSSLGLDTSKSLKSQDCPYYSDGGSWYDYFRDVAASTAKSNLYLAEKADEKGVVLDEVDQASIQAVIEDYYSYADTNDYSRKDIFSLMFGRGVKEADVRDCLELTALASKYVRTWQNALEYSDEEISEYYEKNKSNFQKVDYLSYAVKAEDTAKKDTYDAAKAKADALAAVGSADAFKAWVEKDYRNANALTEKFTQADQDKGAKEAVETIEYTGINTGMVGNTDASNWLFKEAKDGDTFIVDDKKGTYTVYFCTREAYRDESVTHTIRQILLSDSTYGKDGKAKDMADKLMAEMKKAGLTDVTFATYATKYSDDSNSANVGGLCKNYADSSFLDEVAAWNKVETRKEGDFEAVAYDGGYALCYYIGEGVAAWEADCISGLTSKDYSEAYETWQKDVKLTENEKGYDKICSLL